ncbi:MAG: hypothetical protein ACFCVE_10660 [Phycisphaerae bacterium]
MPLFLANFLEQNPMAAVVTGLAIVATMYLTLRPKLRRKKDPLADVPQRMSMSQQRNVERQVNQIMVDLSEMSREVLGQLDTRAAKIEALIRDADERIAELRRLEHMPKQATAAEAGDGVTPADRPRLADAARAAPSFPGDPTTPDPQHDEIYDLADAGEEAPEIARRLDRPLGEVELILALRARARA